MFGGGGVPAEIHHQLFELEAVPLAPNHKVLCEFTVHRAVPTRDEASNAELSENFCR